MSTTNSKYRDEDWPANNRRRGELIDRQIACTLTMDEYHELADLQAHAEDYLDRVTPVSLNGLGEAEAAITQRAMDALLAAEIVHVTQELVCAGQWLAREIRDKQMLAGPGGDGGCHLLCIRGGHDKKCQACESNSATLYQLGVGRMRINICPFCKASIRSDIDRIEGPDDCF